MLDRLPAQFKVKVAHRGGPVGGFQLEFLPNPRHHVQAVVHPDGEQQDGNGVHGRVEGHLHADELQPSGEAVGR